MSLFTLLMNCGVLGGVHFSKHLEYWNGSYSYWWEFIDDQQHSIDAMWWEAW